MPISPLFIMWLMRNHSVGESPNLGKHTVSIDLFTEDISLLGLARHLSFSISIKNDLGKTQSLTGLLAAVTVITIEISYSGWVMGAIDSKMDQYWTMISGEEGQIVISLSFLIFKEAVETSGPERKCVQQNSRWVHERVCVLGVRWQNAKPCQ